MTFDEIIKDIEERRFKPVYFLTGDEPYFIDLIAEKIEHNVLNEGEKAFNQVVLYGKEIEIKTIVDEASQYPMMSEYRVVIIREAQEMRDITALEPYITKPSNSTLLVLCYKYKKPDGRTSFAQKLKKNAVYFESKKLYENQLPSWITHHIKAKGFKAETGVAELLSEYIGTDLSKISNEIEKLTISNAVSKKITMDDVREQIGISKEFDMFELQKSLGNKDFVKSAQIIKHYILNPKNAPGVVIIGNLFGYFNKLYITKTNSQLSDVELAKIIGGSPYFMKEYKMNAKNYSTEHLYKIIQSIKTADHKIKGIGASGSNDEAVLKEVLISCMFP